jgi:hypothetical protein
MQHSKGHGRSSQLWFTQAKYFPHILGRYSVSLSAQQPNGHPVRMAMVEVVVDDAAAEAFIRSLTFLTSCSALFWLFSFAT